MESNVFYRKYRPQRLEELDLPEIRESLGQLVKSKNIPHALLFSGPKGTGKTSAARIVAKTINCLADKDRPCNKCSLCQEITLGSAVDLIEIDAASHRGIDDIRTLTERIKLSPAKCKYKVYIIDEVHMLTMEAFNALLKTLEEPPAHAVFILCTTEPEKLPGTILSRCLRFNFRQAKKDEILASLKRVVKGENLEVEEGVLETIYNASEGSFRDGQKLLDQLSSAGKKITLSNTEKLLGAGIEVSPKKLFGLLAKNDAKGAIEELDRAVNAGADLIVFTRKILDYLRMAMLERVGISQVKVPEESKKYNLSQIKKLIALFSQAIIELKNTPIPQLPLEIAIVEYCGLSDQIVSNSEDEDNDIKLPKIDTSAKAACELSQVESHWAEILTKVKPLNHSIEALLRGCRPLKIDGDKLFIEVFYKFHKERLEADKCRRIIEDVISGIVNVPIKVRCVLGDKKPAKPLVSEAENVSIDLLEAAENIFKN